MSAISRQSNELVPVGGIRRTLVHTHWYTWVDRQTRVDWHTLANNSGLTRSCMICSCCYSAWFTLYALAALAIYLFDYFVICLAPLHNSLRSLVFLLRSLSISGAWSYFARARGFRRSESSEMSARCTHTASCTEYNRHRVVIKRRALRIGEQQTVRSKPFAANPSRPRRALMSPRLMSPHTDVAAH